MAQTINANLRMTWDASIVAVHSAREAIANRQGARADLVRPRRVERHA